MKNVTEGLELLYRLIESLPDGIIIYDLEGKVTLLNRIVLNQFDLEGSISEYLDQPVRNIISNKALESRIVKSITRGRFNFQLDNIKVGNVYLDVVGKKILEGTIMICHDVTLRVESENLTLKNLIKGQELERKRLAREIHDGVGPSLSSIRLGLDALANKTTDDNFKNKIKSISSDISTVAQEIREVSHDLMPSSILDFGIKSALDSLINRLSKSSDISFETDINVTDEVPHLSQSQALNIYRIIQESIHNGMKHGKADIFKISLNEEESYVSLKIADNGAQSNQKVGAGIGLENMNARIQSMNGRLEINDLSEEGYEVSAWIPIMNENNTI